MVAKRNRDGTARKGGMVATEPAVPYIHFTTAHEVRDGLVGRGRHALVSLRNQISVPHSQLPLPLQHQNVVLIQHYIGLSPAFEEIFRAWRIASEGKDSGTIAAAMELLASLLHLINPLPYFRSSAASVVARVTASGEIFAQSLNRIIQSAVRDYAQAGLALAAACMQAELPDLQSASRAAKSSKVWDCLLEGGAVKALPKLLSMRRKGGFANDADPLDKPDIRHLALELIIPIFGHSSFAQSSRHIMRPFWSNVRDDPSRTLLRVFAAVWRAISTQPTPAKSRKISLTLLDEMAVENIMKLFGRRDASEEIHGYNPSEMACHFLLQICTKPGVGICFPDEGWYRRKGKGRASDLVAEVDTHDGPSQTATAGAGSGLHNRILANILRKIGPKTVEDGLYASLVEGILRSCPELVSGYWPSSGLSLEPRLTSQWISTISFVGRIVSLALPATATFQTASTQVSRKASPPSLQALVEATLPSPLTKQHLSKGLQHQSPLVQHLTALTIARSLQKMVAIRRLFADLQNGADSSTVADARQTDDSWADTMRDLEMELRKRLPEIAVVVAFAQKSASAQAMHMAAPEADSEAAAQAELLTESALRLFGLYQHSLPGSAQEVRFDAGKLLVSSVSAKQEAESRKLMREGSVVSDVGSVASIGSIGSVGSIGMGGGFGQARGDVDGFDALSQVHVIQLLGNTAGWSWANKAGGSQYSYFYHLLQLYLETPHVTTRLATEQLLFRLLSQSTLFEHDIGEVNVWIDNLPSLVDQDVPSGPELITERLHLLAFLDDCVKRCLRAPHKYMEDIVGLGPTELERQSSSLPSPLLATALEQLQAKVAGHVIPADAALAIIRYIRGIGISLSCKTISSRYLFAVMDKLISAVEAAEVTRGGQLSDLRRAAELGKIQLNSLLVGKPVGAKQIAPATELPRSLQHIVRDTRPGQAIEALSRFADQREGIGGLLQIPWEWLALHLGPQHPLLLQYIATCSLSKIPQIAAVLSRMLQSAISKIELVSQSRAIVELLQSCLRRPALSDDTRQSIKTALFRQPSLTDQVDSVPLRLIGSDLAALLDTTRASDIELARPFVEACQQASPDKLLDDKHLQSCEDWAGYMSDHDAQLLISLLAAAHSVETDWKTVKPAIAQVLGRLFLRVTESSVVWQHLGIISGVELYDAAATILKRAIPTSDVKAAESVRHWENQWTKDAARSGERASAVGTLMGLMDIKPNAIEFVAVCCSLSEPFAMRVHKEILAMAWTERSAATLSPVFAALARRNIGTTTAASTLVPCMVKAFANGNNQAQLAEVLVLQSRSEVDTAPLIAQALSAEAGKIESRRTAAFLALLADLMRDRGEIYSAAAVAILEPALRWLVSQMSDIADISGECQAALTAATQVLGLLPDAAVSAYSAESVMLVVTQDRITNVDALSLAAILIPKSELRAATIRQSLQSLVSSKGVARAATLALEDPLRKALLRLYRVLCHASPYVACQPDLLEPMLAFYRGTTHSSDLDLQSAFKLFETYRKLSVASMFRTWTGTGVKIDGEARRSLDVLTALDPTRVFATCVHFDAARGVDGEQSDAVHGNDAPYDVVFLLSIASMVFGEANLSGLDWVEILRSNVLGAAICALSSRKEAVRDAAAYVLSLAMPLIEASPFQERPAVRRTMRLLRHSIPASEDGTVSRLPRITTFFFAHVLRAIADPSSALYPLVSRFLLQRPTLDSKDVPMLYGMLYAAGDGSKRDRRWMVRFIRDATQGQDDWHILRRRHTFALLETIYESTGEQALRKLVLEAMASIVKVPSATYQLVDREGLLPWLSMQMRTLAARPQTHRQDLPQTTEISKRIIVNLVHRERQDSSAASIDQPAIQSTKLRRWVAEMEGLLYAACDLSDLDHLQQLAECALRLALCPGMPASSDVYSALVGRLRALDLDLDAGGATANRSWVASVEALFRCRLEMPADAKTMAALRECDQWLKARILVCPGEIGDWVRREWMRGG